jgi:hypothetical protein
MNRPPVPEPSVLYGIVENHAVVLRIEMTAIETATAGSAISLIEVT